MQSSNSKDVRRVYLIMCAVVVLAGLYFAFSTVIPYSVTEQYYCPYCRAYRNDTKILGLKMTPKIKESIVTEYWRSDIDANHKHSWQHFSTLFHMIGGTGHGCGYIDSDHYMLQREAEIAILSSFKTPAERKAFAERFLAWDRNKPEAESDQRRTAIEKLSDAYDQNPSRKDWQKILKQLGAIK